MLQYRIRYLSNFTRNNSTRSNAFKSTHYDLIISHYLPNSHFSRASTTSSSSSGSSSHGVAIGAGVGVPLGFLALAGLGYFFFRRRKAHQKKPQTYELQNRNEGLYNVGYGGAGGVYQDNMSPPPISEADSAFPGTAAKKGYFGNQQYEQAPTQPPSELPNSQVKVVHEMGT
jgi:hypothetical protein